MYVCMSVCMGFCGAYNCYGLVRQVSGSITGRCQWVGYMSYSPLLNLRAEESCVLRYVKPPHRGYASRKQINSKILKIVIFSLFLLGTYWYVKVINLLVHRYYSINYQHIKKNVNLFSSIKMQRHAIYWNYLEYFTNMSQLCLDSTR